MTMLEKVARALHDSLYEYKDEHTESDYLEMKESFMKDARAALTAMLEPTYGMIVSTTAHKHGALFEHIREDYKNMIRAALQELQDGQKR